MSVVNRFVKNTTILILAKAIQPLLTFYLIITISVKIGVEGFGVYSTIFKYIPIFQIVAGFGLRNLLAREIAQNKNSAQKYIVAGSYIALICSIASVFLVGLVVKVLSNNPLVIYGTILASVSLIASGFADIYEGVISGYEQLVQVGYALFMESVFRVAISLWLLFNGYGIIALVIVYVIGRFLNTLYLFYYINKNIAKPTGKVDRKFAIDFFQQAKTFALIMVCVTIYWNVDGIMLESLRSAEEAGYYSAAFRFFALSMILVHSYVASLFPVISNYFQKSRTDFETACRKSLRFLILATLPIAIALSFQAEKIILMLFKQDFMPSVKVLQLLIWGLIPYAVSQIFAYALIASSNQKIDLTVNAASMFLNIILNSILIPLYGFMGATFATLFSILIYVGLQFPFVVPKLIVIKYKAILGSTVKIILAALFMIGSIILLRNTNVLIVLPLSLVVYCLSLLVSGFFTENDKYLLFKLLRVKY